MQFLLEDSDGSSGSPERSEDALRTIVARALERNSRLLILLAGPAEAAPVPGLELQLLQQLAVWRLFLRSPQHTRARDVCERLRQAQQLFEAPVAGLRVVQQVRDSLTAGETQAEEALRIVEQGLQRLLDRTQPRRDLERLLLTDSAALHELAADALDPVQQADLEAELAANLLQETRKARRRCQQALSLEGGAEQWLRARRWLQLHLAQMELFSTSLSEEARQRLWYRHRLLRVLERYAGTAVLLQSLDEALQTRQLTPRDKQALASLLIELQARFGTRAARLYRHAFPTRPQAEAIVDPKQLPAANADRLEEAPEPAPRDIALR